MAERGSGELELNFMFIGEQIKKLLLFYAKRQ
jgi:hypothetical protein